MIDVSRCTVDADAILGKSPVALETASGERIVMPTSEQKSA